MVRAHKLKLQEKKLIISKSHDWFKNNQLRRISMYQWFCGYATSSISITHTSFKPRRSKQSRKSTKKVQKIIMIKIIHIKKMIKMNYLFFIFQNIFWLHSQSYYFVATLSQMNKNTFRLLQIVMMGQTPRPVSRDLLVWSRRELEALASAVQPPGVRPFTFGSSGTVSRYLSRAILKSSIEHLDIFLILAGSELNNLGPLTWKVCSRMV